MNYVKPALGTAVPVGFASWADWAASGEPLQLPTDPLAVPDAMCSFLAGAIMGLLSREGFDVASATTECGDYLPDVLIHSKGGHVYQVRIRYDGPMSIEQLATIAARNGVTLQSTGEPGEFIATASRPGIPAEVAQHVLHSFEGSEFREPGSFTAALIECMKRADPTNLRLLAQLYPDYARAVTMYQQDVNGREQLLAAIEPTP